MLPATYKDFHNKYKNLPFINLMCASPTRIYYKDGKYEAFITSVEGILPLVCKTALCLTNTLCDILKNDPQIDLTFHHPLDTTQRKKEKIYKLTGQYDGKQNVKAVLLKFLLLLI